MHIEITELSALHAPEYMALRKASEMEFPQFVGPSAERELMADEQSLATLLDRYAEEGTSVVGAFDAGQLVGVIATSRRLSPKFQHRAFIWGMYIFKSHRQSEVGTQLLDYVKAWAVNHNDVLLLWLQVTLSNQAAIGFYQKHGFAIYGTEPKALFAEDAYHDVHYMQLETMVDA